jgi:cell wall-associated NlpC family hydrolase
MPRRILVVLPVAGLVAIAMPIAAPGAGAASPLSLAQARAAQIEAEIQQTGQQIDALDQQYEAAQAKKASVDHQITLTEAQISVSLGKVAKDKSVLHKAAIEAYVTGGTSAASEAIFSSSQTAAMDSTVYTQVIAGDLNISMADLHTAIAQLDAQRQTLDNEDAQAAQAIATARGAYVKAQALESEQSAALAQVKGQIATLVAEQQAATVAAQRAAAEAAVASASASASASGSYAPAPSSHSTAPRSAAPPPPPAPGGGAAEAVRAAESQLGVPYVWGAEDPGHGFDCSGLTAWAWSQAGVYLPHYSGAQMADTTPVPVSDLQPGDLLFYGPGGSAHVAMYVGGGEMIEATFPGTVVRIDPVRLGYTFAGAGRP